MILRADEIARRLDSPGSGEEPLIITPKPGIEELRSSGTASVDLRLGTWIVSLRQSRISKLGVSNEKDNNPGENRLTRQYYVPFGKSFILHPTERCIEK